MAEAAAAQQAAEAGGTPEEREADRRRMLDAELDQARQEQNRGRQRKR
ncbi:MAG: hypothetical protein ACYDEA_11790 [Candidatus Dormibacteria bacterium]